MVLAVLARLTAPPTQSLETLAPTPSTVSFTVSTRRARASVAAKLRGCVALLTRVGVGACVLALLWTKWRVSYGLSTDVLLWVLGGPRAARLMQGVGAVGWGYAAAGAVAVGFGVLRRGYTGVFPVSPFMECADGVQKSR